MNDIYCAQVLAYKDNSSYSKHAGMQMYILAAHMVSLQNIIHLNYYSLLYLVGVQIVIMTRMV